MALYGIPLQLVLFTYVTPPEHRAGESSPGAVAVATKAPVRSTLSIRRATVPLGR